MIKKHAETWHPAYVSDYMPTLLDLIGVPHEHATWSADGISLLPLIKKLGATGAANDGRGRSARTSGDRPLARRCVLVCVYLFPRLSDTPACVSAAAFTHP